MAARFKMNAKGARDKLKKWFKSIKDSQQTTAALSPTPVIEELSRYRGRGLLKDLTRGKAQAVKAESAARVKKAVVEGGPRLQTNLAKQYRRWVYRYVEELLVDVRDKGVWGPPQRKTIRRKESLPGNGGAGPGVPPGAYGVRATRPDWRAYQKGKKTGDGSRDRAKLDGKAEIKVWYKGRRIRAPEVRD